LLAGRGGLLERFLVEGLRLLDDVGVLRGRRELLHRLLHGLAVGAEQCLGDLEHGHLGLGCDLGVRAEAGGDPESGGVGDVPEGAEEHAFGVGSGRDGADLLEHLEALRLFGLGGEAQVAAQRQHPVGRVRRVPGQLEQVGCGRGIGPAGQRADRGILDTGILVREMRENGLERVGAAEAAEEAEEGGLRLRGCRLERVQERADAGGRVSKPFGDGGDRALGGAAIGLAGRRDEQADELRVAGRAADGGEGAERGGADAFVGIRRSLQERRTGVGDAASANGAEQLRAEGRLALRCQSDDALIDGVARQAMKAVARRSLDGALPSGSQAGQHINRLGIAEGRQGADGGEAHRLILGVGERRHRGSSGPVAAPSEDTDEEHLARRRQVPEQLRQLDGETLAWDPVGELRGLPGHLLVR